eukprot:6771122-Prymnesium_polylepis.1
MGLNSESPSKSSSRSMKIAVVSIASLGCSAKSARWVVPHGSTPLDAAARSRSLSASRRRLAN